MTHAHGSVPIRRSRAILPAADLPRRASIKTVESSSSRLKSTGATPVRVTLGADPGRRVGVPIVGSVAKCSECRLDIVPAPFIVKRALYELGDEGAAPTGTHSAVQLGDKLVIQRYVHTHGPSLAHSPEQ